MKRKKRQKKKSGPSVPLPLEDRALLDSLLAKCKHETPELLVPQIPTPGLARALVDHLPTDDETSIPLLLALHKAYNQKNIRKAIKRAAFKLRQNGFDAPSFTAESRPGLSFSLKPNDRDKAVAFLGVIDGYGSRGVYISLPRIPSGYDIGIGLVNDETGIIEFHAAHYSKKKMKELKTAVQDEMGVNIAASISHALTVTENAYGKSLQGALDVPQDYLEFRSLMLSHGSVLDRSPVYDFFPEWSNSGDAPTLSQLEKLFAHPSMQHWIIPLEKLEPLLLEFDKVEEGPLLLSEAQQQERFRAIKEKWAEDYFPPEMLNVLKYRLEEMAYVFHKQDEKDYAALTLSAAAGLAEKGAFQSLNPVLGFLLEKSIAHYEELRDEMGGKNEPLVDELPRIIQP